MDTEKNIQVVKTMTENGITGRWDIVKPLVADNLVLHVPKGLPYGGDYHGWQGYMDIFAAMGKFWGEISVGPNKFSAFDDKVVVVSYLKGRIAKTGKPISMPLTEIWEIKDGKVCDITAFYYDTKAIADGAI